jgi:hypothetical protein
MNCKVPLQICRSEPTFRYWAGGITILGAIEDVKTNKISFDENICFIFQQFYFLVAVLAFYDYGTKSENGSGTERVNLNPIIHECGT